MTFEIYIPENLKFSDYIAVLQTARTWADGYDRKDIDRLSASLASSVVVDYSHIVPHWGEKTYTGLGFAQEWLSPEHLGLKPLATQHLLGLPYFKLVADEEIVVEWQQLVSHGRREGDVTHAVQEGVSETSDHRSYVEHRFIKVDGKWKIAKITPKLIYNTGNFMRIRRPEGEE
ncbi:scytalone dehydratase [Diaporthe amygdali]|uniref:scytalone dehydratase n=1 Tax=Phomopsis amygdali TaxID=1214568 RepID=UPI0022FF2A53|nr:scytalone dehydratase [Diaporthe amygdali]KAJ0116965.1 scytalone dehydratase [Diaporthe amygdali]